MFIQIGNRAIKSEYIESVFFHDEKVEVFTVATDGEMQNLHVFEGDDMDTFMTWWNMKAEVWRG